MAGAKVRASRQLRLRKIIETCYSAHIALHVTIRASYQNVISPAYNRKGRPVSFFAIRSRAGF
jgi:hypothetical protein